MTHSKSFLLLSAWMTGFFFFGSGLAYVFISQPPVSAVLGLGTFAAFFGFLGWATSYEAPTPLPAKRPAWLMPLTTWGLTSALTVAGITWAQGWAWDNLLVAVLFSAFVTAMVSGVLSSRRERTESLMRGRTLRDMAKRANKAVVRLATYDPFGIPFDRLAATIQPLFLVMKELEHPVGDLKRERLCGRAEYAAQSLPERIDDHVLPAEYALYGQLAKALASGDYQDESAETIVTHLDTVAASYRADYLATKK